MEGSLKGTWCALLIIFTLSFGMSLEEAQEKALKHHREILVEELELHKKRHEVREKRGKFFPTVNLELSFNLSKRQSFTFRVPPFPPREFVFQKGSYPKLTLQVSQDLFNLRTIKEYQVSKEVEALQYLSLEERKRKVLLKVREAYLNALKAKALVNIYEKHLELVKAHLRDVQELYREGIVPLKDVLETRVKLQEVKEKLSDADAKLKKSFHYLSYLTGEEVYEINDLKVEEYLDLVNSNPDKLMQELLKRNVLVKLLKKRIEIAQLQKEAVASSFYPVAVLEAYYQRTEESDLFPKDRYLVSFAFRWNLFSGFRKFRMLDISEISRRQAVHIYEDTLNKLNLQLVSLLEDTKAVRERIALAEEQLRDAREHLKMAQEKYKAGIGTNTEVLDAQSYLITAENTLKISRYDLLLLEFKLREVVGYE